MDTINPNISRITIKGYKSIKQCDVAFGKTNVLIGSNGAGKTNFVSVFTLLKNLLNENLQIYVARCGMNALLYHGRKITDELSVGVVFGEYSYHFTLIPTDDNRLFVKDEFFSSHHQKKRYPISTASYEAKWRNGSGETIDTILVPILQQQRWNVYHFHDTGRDARVKQEHNISNNQVLMEDAGNLAAYLLRLKRGYPKHYGEIISAVQTVAPFFSDFILEPQDENREQIVLRWKQKGCEDVFNASQMSDGTLRFACLATLLLQPPELQPRTIIIDEPELGLHPYAISIFAEMVRQLSDKRQTILSTQSVELLNEFNVEDVLVVERGASGSQFKRLSQTELNVWLEEDYTLGELWQKNILGGRLSK